jgi:hypothetical protein
MRELNTKIGVFLTTYSQLEIDLEIEQYMERNDSSGCILFMDSLRSFNPESTYYVTEKEAKRFTGLEKGKSKKNPHNMYTNYKGNPFGIPINETKLYFIDPILSLKSAFEAAIPEFNFDKDFFHVRIVK